MRVLRLGFLCVAAVLLSAQPAFSFILRFSDFRVIGDSCPNNDMAGVDVILGEAFAFTRDAIASGSANLLTLRSTFVLTRSSIPADEPILSSFTDCVLKETTALLGRTGVRLIQDISGLDAEFKNRSFGFFPTGFGESISAYQLVRVRFGQETHLTISDVTCGNAEFAIAYVAHPLDSFQPGLEPLPRMFRPLENGRLELTLSRDSEEVVKAIEESLIAIDDMIWLNDDEKAAYRLDFESFIDSQGDELWLWVNLTSKEDHCSALLSVAVTSEP